MRAAGLRVFYSEHEVRAAQEWHDEIGYALARCNWFLVVLSTNAPSSRWLKLELVYALQHERYHGRIVPLWLRGSDRGLAKVSDKVSWTLGAFQHVDFRDGFGVGLEALTRLWRLS